MTTPGTREQITAATEAVNAASKAYTDGYDAADPTDRQALADTYRNALNQLRELNGGRAVGLDAHHSAQEG